MHFEESKDSSVINQYIAASIVSLSTFCYGICVGWISPSLEHLQSDSSPTGYPLSDDELDTVAAMFCIGGFVGTYLFGFIAKRLGRKVSGLLIGIPYTLCWILKLSVPNIVGVLLARILAGLGGAGGLLVAPLYCLEIGNIYVRGALGSIAILAINAGILFSYTIGAIFSYYVVLWINLTLPIIYIILFYFMPETPPTLVRMQKYKEASISIAWLRKISVDNAVTKGILENLKMDVDLASKNKKINIINTETAKDNSFNKSELTNFAGWKLLLKSRATQKAFFVCFVMITIQVYVGMFAILNFASAIFYDAGSPLSPNISAIILAILQLLGSYASTLLMERLGRKILFLVTASVISLALAILGIYFYFKTSGYDMSTARWIPLVTLSLGICADAIGVGTVPYVIINEVFMLQVREIAVTIIVSWVWVTEFIQTKYYSRVINTMGLSGMFCLFSTIGVLGVIFCSLFIPETKGKSLTEILKYFDKNIPSKQGDENPVNGNYVGAVI